MKPFVHMADMDNVVITVTTVESKTIAIVGRIPASPTHQGILRNIMTPQMLSRHLANTPLTQSNLIGSARSTSKSSLLSPINLIWASTLPPSKCQKRLFYNLFISCSTNLVFETVILWMQLKFHGTKKSVSIES